MKSILAVVISLAFVVLALMLPALAQDQITLGDGLNNSHFNGNVNPVVTMLIPSIYCNGGVCSMAAAGASGSGHVQSNGNYMISSPSNAPFYLTHNPDDSFTITQTNPINFTYTSPQGTLTGLLWFASISKTNSQLHSTMIGTMTAPGGTFAPYFPNGGHVTIDVGLTFPLQILWQVHGFSAVEFQSGTIVPAGNCAPLTQGYWKNHPGAWQDGSGLTLGTSFYTNDQLMALLNTPVQGDASVNLAHQLIAALLNIDNGTDGTPVQPTIADANNLIGAGPLPEHIPSSSPIGQQMVGDANVLDNFNNGLLGTGCAQH